MPKAKDVLMKVHEHLKGAAVFTSFPMSLLLIGLEELIEVQLFSCPCKVELNALLTVAIAFTPALFTFTLIFLFLRPFKHGCSRCCGGANESTQNCPKAFAACLIPPVVWLFVLLLDGEYVACGMTNWKGVYVFDKELSRSWCKPTEMIRNETELRELTRYFIQQSQVNITYCII